MTSLLLILAFAGEPHAKPVVCTTWAELYDSARKPVGVLCTDRKTPKVLTHWRVVDLDGTAMVVGW